MIVAVIRERVMVLGGVNRDSGQWSAGPLMEQANCGQELMPGVSSFELSTLERENAGAKQCAEAGLLVKPGIV